METPRLDPEVKQLEFNDMAFIIKENEVIPFKKVVIEKEDVEDEK